MLLSMSRRAGSIALAALTFACVVGPRSAEKVLVARLVDDIVYADLVGDGDCVNGCRREEHAVAFVAGNPVTRSCSLQMTTPFDTTTSKPGLLSALHYCEDATGALIEQGKGPCKFHLCVDFDWTEGEGDEDGKLSYDVVIIRTQKPRAPHTVYVDLTVVVDPTAAGLSVDSCERNGTCVGVQCAAPEAYTAVVSREPRATIITTS